MGRERERWGEREMGRGVSVAFLISTQQTETASLPFLDQCMMQPLRNLIAMLNANTKIKSFVLTV